jgi:hypothetical protein
MNTVEMMEVSMMLLSVLERRFEQATLGGWQGYALADFPEVEDPRRDCFEQLKETISDLAAPALQRAGELLSVDPARFHYVMNNLTETVGWDYFPESAAEFVTDLIHVLETLKPEDSWRWTEIKPTDHHPIEFAEK